MIDGLQRGGFLGSVTRKNVNLLLDLDKFDIEYTPKGQVSQFYSELTLRDKQGKQLEHKVMTP